MAMTIHYMDVIYCKYRFGLENTAELQKNSETLEHVAKVNLRFWGKQPDNFVQDYEYRLGMLGSSQSLVLKFWRAVFFVLISNTISNYDYVSVKQRYEIYEVSWATNLVYQMGHFLIEGALIGFYWIKRYSVSLITFLYVTIYDIGTTLFIQDVLLHYWHLSRSYIKSGGAIVGCRNSNWSYRVIHFNQRFLKSVIKIAFRKNGGQKKLNKKLIKPLFLTATIGATTYS